ALRVPQSYLLTSGVPSAADTRNRLAAPREDPRPIRKARVANVPLNGQRLVEFAINGDHARLIVLRRVGVGRTRPLWSFVSVFLPAQVGLLEGHGVQSVWFYQFSF